MNGIFSLVDNLLKEQGSEDLIFLVDNETRKHVVEGISAHILQECTGEYFYVNNKRVWVKNVTSSIPKSSFTVHVISSREYSLEEKKLYVKWKKHAK
jgi:hypothetical protein